MALPAVIRGRPLAYVPAVASVLIGNRFAASI